MERTDIQYIYGVFTTAWLYLTPIFYPETILPEGLRAVLQINPLYHFLKSVRMCILDGLSPEPVVYVRCMAIALAMLVLGAAVLYRNQEKFVLYL